MTTTTAHATSSKTTHPGVIMPLGWVRPFMLVGSVAFTFLFSLVDRLRLVGTQTPIAYFAIVPALALGIGMWRYRIAQPGVADVAAIDRIVGCAFLVLAAAITVGGPVIFNAYATWAHPDLLALPLYATGAFCLLYGIAGFRWGGPALALLFLIWPTPLQIALPGVLDALTNFTAAALRVIVAIVPLSTQPVASDSALFTISTPQGDGTLGIGSACAGFEAISTIGLLGGAMLLVTDSTAASRWRRLAGKSAWLLCGIALATIGNIIRIAIVFSAAHSFGVNFAMAVVHPYVGMIALAVDLIVLLAVRSRFGLRFMTMRTPRPLPMDDLRWGLGMAFVTILVLSGLVWSGAPLFATFGNGVAEFIAAHFTGRLFWGGVTSAFGFLIILLILSMPSDQPGRRALSAFTGEDRLLRGVTVAFVISATTLLACANTTVAASIDGQSLPDGMTLVDYETALPPIAGAAPVYEMSVPWLQAYLGSGSSREIYDYPPMHTDEELFTIIDTAPSVRGLNANSLASCYEWHAYNGLRQNSVVLGHGVTATALTWYDLTTSRGWVSVSWMQPISKEGETYHQRIALTASFAAPRSAAERDPLTTSMSTETRMQAAEILNNLWRS